MTPLSRLPLGAALALTLALTPLLGTGGAPQEEEDAPQFAHLRLDAREYSLGRSDAPLTLLEFTDYQCPYCRKFQAETWPLLKKNYIDTGKLRFIVRDLPLSFHSSARPAAEAAHCAAEQGKFWEMHHAMPPG
jgi:protein-disulfide isomerase